MGREVIKTTSTTVRNYRKQACTAMAGETICRILQDGTVSTSLAENYLSTSTYAYVANNPVSYSDVDGRWFDQDGHIIDTSGQTYGFLNSSVKPHYATNYLGVNPSDGGGGSGYTFTGNAAASVFNYFANGGGLWTEFLLTTDI
ncbi:hypothetical protein ATE47_11900 [Chryseobacterium sp. IHB B 17019]|uniref:hypothetical protein n=1 Tax=Chryseobacterium sp. IHB B 17019 TaxID=1721091 RepID=UPI0007220B52|nr:hypothetical protein [Chryseobacterium sp. IHB B 17019]ALR31179.1 hypothetical protein ATE47_11900 [Chryseobacterium sp. IHB B 17019]